MWELLYGGARGGGKTDCGIMWLVKPPHIHHPKYRALVLRRTYQDLADWIDRARYLYAPFGARFREHPMPRFTFPSGAIIRLGHLRDQDAIYKYTGHEYQKILIEELTQIPTLDTYLQIIASCRTTQRDLSCHVFCTTNPGGPGHGWVKLRWRLGSYGGKSGVAWRTADGRLRMFIQATLDDNPTLLERDRGYARFLETLPEPLRSAWRYGNWDVFMGQMFNFSIEDHVIEPIPIPPNAPILMTFDWGFARPYSVGWWWLDEERRLYRFAELYGCVSLDEHPDLGLRQTDSEIAEAILRREKELGIENRVGLRLCDPTCFNRKPDYLSGGQTDSTADVFARYGLHLVAGQPDRVQKVRQFHERLRVPRDAMGQPIRKPMLLVYDTCHAFIRLIPALQADPNKPEDVDKTQPDHVYDEAALACMAHPLAVDLHLAAQDLVEMGARL